MRTLYYVPIIHSIEDYGSLGPTIQEAFMRQTGEAEFTHLEKNINEYWEIVEKKIAEMLPDVRGLIVYHDGFPVGSSEKILELFGHIMKDHPKSPDFQLVKKLIDKGAMLEGTEDISLAIEQLNLYKRAVEAITPKEQAKILAVQSSCSQEIEIMGLRDVFIAQRINETLPDGYQAILFIGRAHKVIKELDRLEETDQLIYPLRVIYL